jgi:hypothetical protein
MPGNWRKDLKEIFIHCDCGNEVLRLCYWTDDMPEDLYLSMYDQCKPAITIRDKWRWIWRILTRGTPFEDEICLDRAQVEKAIEFCTEYLKLGGGDKNG